MTVRPVTAMPEPLTVGEVRDLVPRISYKPGWTFMFTDVVDMGHRDGVRCGVRVQARVTDSRTDQPGATSTIGVLVRFHDTDLWHGELWVLHMIRDHILVLERHETDEWFAKDGNIIESPHPKERDKVVRVRDSAAPHPPVYADAFTMSMVSH